MKTWNVTLRRDSLLGSPIEAKVTAHMSCLNHGALEFWLVVDNALIPSLVLLRAIPAGTWSDVQLERPVADNGIEDMLAADTTRTLRAVGTNWEE